MPGPESGQSKGIRDKGRQSTATGKGSSIGDLGDMGYFLTVAGPDKWYAAVGNLTGKNGAREEFVHRPLHEGGVPSTVAVDFLIDLPHTCERVFEGGNDPAKVMEIGGLQFPSPSIFEPFLAHLVGAHAKLPDLPGHWANRQVAVDVDAL